MDEIINKPSMAHQKSPPKKTIKRKCKSAGSTAKIRKVVKEKFKHYDLFTYKKNKVTENIKSEENDSSQVNVMNRSNLMEFDSPDKTDIIGNISCNEQDFKIDKKFVYWILKFYLISLIYVYTL